jgi:hypothetical protein
MPSGSVGLLLQAYAYTFGAASGCVKPLSTPPNRRKTAQINLRVSPELKAAAEKAAADDARSLTSLVEKLLRDFVCETQGGRKSLREN